MASKEKTVSDPLVVGKTLLPKRPLSFRWVFEEAKTFLDFAGVHTSPVFSVSMPLKTDSADHEHQTSLWYLEAQNSYDNSRKEYLIGINLGYRKSTTPAECTCKVLVSGLISIINSKVKPVSVGTYNVSLKDDWKTRLSNFQYSSSIDSNGTLTIQIDATLLCYTDPIEVLHEEDKPPLDNITAGMRCLFQDKLLSDVTIKCGNEEFKAHKAILASQSPVFRKMFEVDMKEKQSNVVEISDIDPVVTSDLLAYLYTGTAPNMDALVKDLLNVANKYEISSLCNVREEA